MNVIRYLLSVLISHCCGWPSLISWKCQMWTVVCTRRHALLPSRQCAKPHRKPTASRTHLLGNFIVAWTLVTTIPRSCRNILRNSSTVHARSEDRMDKQIQEVMVCENRAVLMNGNLYVKFVREEQTTAALKTLLQEQQYFEGRLTTNGIYPCWFYSKKPYVATTRKTHPMQAIVSITHIWRQYRGRSSGSTSCVSEGN